MPEHYLIVSDPPHGEVDLPAAAKCLGCTAADVRMRSHHPAPEIWLAETDHAAARERRRTLAEAGLEVCLVPGKVLAAVHAPQHVDALAFSAAGFSARIDSETLEMPRSEPVIAVAAQPSADAKERRAAAGDPHASLFVDFYVAASDGWRAGRLVPDHVDLSDLGPLKQTGFAGNVRAILDELRDRFDRGYVDERLLSVSYRFTVVGGVPMSRLLGGISDELGQTAPFDLASRLAFLTAQRKQGA